MPFEAQIRSLRLFISDVMPQFREQTPAQERAAGAGRR
jgi:hypothetical protein